MSVICSNENLNRKENKMTINRSREIRTALLLKQIEKLNNLDLKQVRELIRQKEWEKNNKLYLRRIKANSRGTVRG